MKTDLIVKIQTTLVGFLLLAVPLVFHRGVGDSFDLTKGTILWVVALFLLPPLVAIPHSPLPKSIWIVAGVFGLALVVSLVISPSPLQSLFGQYQRNTGLLTLVGCVIVFLSIASRSPDRNQTLVLILLLAALGGSLYTLLQDAGADPWDWVTPGQDRAVFGTLGNSNTTGGFVGCSVALFAFAALRANSKIIKSMFGAATAFAASAVGILGAFQGVVAGVVGLFLVVLAALWHSYPLRESVHMILVSLIAAVSLFFLDTAGRLVVAVALAVACSGVLLIGSGREVSILQALTSNRPRRFMSSLLTLSIVVAVTVLMWSRVAQQVAEGMRERKYFFGSAWKIFLDKPIFGSGLETFGMYFTRYRASEHALFYEGNRSSSAHSIPLGMLANGGLILGLAYLLFVATIIYMVVKQRQKFLVSPLHLGVVASWITTQIQSLVSVEHVALYVQQFALAGFIVAIASEREHQGSMRRGRSRLARKPKVNPAVLVGGWIVAAILIIPITRPIRADIHGLWSLRYAASGRPAESLDAAREARNLAPWSSQQYIRFAQASYNNKTSDFADVALAAAKNLDYTPPYGIEAAYRVGESGQLSEALRIAELSLSRDPKSRSLRDSVADLYVQIGKIQLSQGLVAEAIDTFERVIELEPSESLIADARAALSEISP